MLCLARNRPVPDLPRGAGLGTSDRRVPRAGILGGETAALYGDAGSADKVFVDLACSSHNAMWEKNHLMLFQATLDWLTSGKVDGKSAGVIRKGY